MQIRYHFALTKIQKLQNFKNNNKKLFSVPIGTPGIARNWPVWPVLFPVWNKGGYMYRFACRYGIYRPYQPVRYEIDSLAATTFNLHWYRLPTPSTSPVMVKLPESSKTCTNTLERLDPQIQNNQFKLYDKQQVCGKWT